MTKLIKYLRGYTLEGIIAPLFKLLEAVFELVVPLLMAKIIDVGIPTGDKIFIWKMVGLMIIMGILGLIASMIAQYFSAKTALGYGTALRKDFYSHINKFSFSQIDAIGTSTLINRLTGDINQSQVGVNMFLRLFMRSPFIVLGALIMSFTIDAKLGIIFCIVTPVIALIIFLITKRTIPIYKQSQSTLDEVATVTNEALKGVRVIRAFGTQKNEQAQFVDSTTKLLGYQKRANRISALLNPATYTITNCAIIALLYWGGRFVNNGRISTGEVVALVNYMTQIMLALIVLSQLIVILTKAQASSIRIAEILAIIPDNNTVTDAVITNKSGCVDFDGVGFAYANGGTVFEDISFTVSTGQRVGIIGGTGSGKSTLINLLAHFYKPTKGVIALNGVNLDEYSDEQLRSIISIVPQSAMLFSGTVRENLIWGKADATDEEIMDAVGIAQADFILKDGGLDAMIYQGGKNFSGGQKQRLTIARALVAKPQILILDDSFSALDYATDFALRKALSEKLPDCTVFSVSQRATSLINCDLILVLDDGRLVGAGTHENLLKTCKVYEEICSTQFSTEDNDD